MDFKVNKLNTANQEKVSSGLFVDIRADLYELFNGSATMPKMSFDVIIKKVDKTQRCYCWDPLVEEANDTCKNCSGSGFRTRRIKVPAVKHKYIGREEWSEAGQRESESCMFYFMHDIIISEEDSIIEVKTDDLGRIPDINNLKILFVYSVRDVEYYRANNGRAEFVACYCSSSV